VENDAKYVVSFQFGLQAQGSKRFPGFLAAAGVLWGSLVIVGFLLLAQEEFTPKKKSLPVTLFPRVFSLMNRRLRNDSIQKRCS
jgi:hypothetical protein